MDEGFSFLIEPDLACVVVFPLRDQLCQVASLPLEGQVRKRLIPKDTIWLSVAIERGPRGVSRQKQQLALPYQLCQLAHGSEKMLLIAAHPCSRGHDTAIC
eukprot:1146745-Pelagomonas_calceolata.AAC.2